MSFRRQYKEYLYISMIFFIAIITVILVVGAVVDHSDQLSKRHLVRLEAERIERVINDSFGYTHRLMTYMGREIVSNKAGKDLQHILDVFKRTEGGNFKEQELFSWSSYDWVSKDCYQLVNSRKGIASDPPDMSAREYCSLNIEKPWHMNVSFPVFGNPSRVWVIPAGIGVTDENDTFLGSIIVGFNISKLARKIETAIAATGVSFLVLDNHHNVVFQSVDNGIDPKTPYFKSLFLRETILRPNSGFLEADFEYGDVMYKYQHDMEHFPYTVLVGFNKSVLAQEFYAVLIPRIVEIVLVGVFGLLILLAIYFLYTRSLLRLSHYVVNVLRGRNTGQLPNTPFGESKKLASRIVRLERLYRSHRNDLSQVKQEKLHLEKSIDVSKTADKEYNLMVDEVNRRLMQPLSVVKDRVNYLSDQLQKGDDLYHFVEDIKRAVAQIDVTYGNISEVELIDVKEIIEKSLAIHRKVAMENGITLESQVPDTLPMMWADPLLLKQLVVAVLMQSIAYTLKHGTVSIEVSVDFSAENKPAYLNIIVKDDGVGMSVDDRKTLGVCSNIISDIGIMKHIVELHKGSIDIVTEYAKGSKFSIRLPYLSKEVLGSGGSQSKNVDGVKVVQFPFGGE